MWINMWYRCERYTPCVIVCVFWFFTFFFTFSSFGSFWRHVRFQGVTLNRTFRSCVVHILLTMWSGSDFSVKGARLEILIGYSRYTASCIDCDSAPFYNCGTVHHQNRGSRMYRMKQVTRTNSVFLSCLHDAVLRWTFKPFNSSKRATMLIGLHQ